VARDAHVPIHFAALSLVGALVGTVFFAMSLSPSLLPRPFVVQGVLSGASFAVGYGLGVAGVALWKFLKLPVLEGRARHALTLAGGVLCGLVAVLFLWQASAWQNSIRAMMGMEEDWGLRPAIIGPVAILVFAVLLVLARLFQRLFRSLSRWLAPHVPRRVSYMVSIVVSVAVFWSLIDGVLVSAMLRTDRSLVPAARCADRGRPAAPHAPGTDRQRRVPGGLVGARTTGTALCFGWAGC
jgi:uncharacterized membrane protein